MAEMTSYPPGTFCWVDLATPDPEASKAFYGDVFGWTARDLPTDLGPPYTMLSFDGRQACGLYRLPPGRGQNAYWSSHVSVSDVDAAAARAVDLGAALLRPPTDVMEEGRICYVQDPTGALVGLWQARTNAGAEIDNQVGARSWNELLTTDTESAAAFYGALFGWTHRISPEVMDGRYVIFELDGTPVGGMLEIQSNWGPISPNWTVYFGVADCDGTLETAGRLGGSVLMGPMEVESVGRFAHIRDPQGATFAVIQFAHWT